jgi:hypothetical protein
MSTTDHITYIRQTQEKEYNGTVKAKQFHNTLMEAQR